MSLLINGMDMPKNMFMKDYTLKVRQDGTAELIDRAIGKSYDVIDVPSPHGRLIDADRLRKALKKQWNVDDDQDFANKTVWREIESAPTIIEKEMN